MILLTSQYAAGLPANHPEAAFGRVCLGADNATSLTTWLTTPLRAFKQFLLTAARLVTPQLSSVVLLAAGRGMLGFWVGPVDNGGLRPKGTGSLTIWVRQASERLQHVAAHISVA